MPIEEGGRAMAAIRIDPDWVSGYAAQLVKGADTLSTAVTQVTKAPLDAESFGSLGETVRVTDAYGRAAETLRGQLARAVESLTAAAHSLDEVAAGYRGSDDDGVAKLNRSGQA